MYGLAGGLGQLTSVVYYSMLSGVGSIGSIIGQGGGMDLSPPVSLSTCLRLHCRAELLTGKDQYRCDRCRRDVDATRRMEMNAPAPAVLTIHLKRFTFRGGGGYSYSPGRKVNTRVRFPVTGLRLGQQWAVEGVAVEEEEGGEGSREKGEENDAVDGEGGGWGTDDEDID
jgi:hypothetical protein